MKRKDYIGRTVVEKAVTPNGVVSTTYYTIKKVSNNENNQVSLLDGQKKQICLLDELGQAFPKFNNNGDLILTISYHLA